MTKRILTVIFFALFMSSCPANLWGMSAVEVIDVEPQAINIVVSESTIHVSGASGEVMQIYNLAGVLVKTVKIDGMDKRFELNLPKGCYIVKVNKTVRKISIK